MAHWPRMPGIIKPRRPVPNLLVHCGRAITFNDHDDLNQRIDDPALDVRPDDILVMRDAGPVGGPGMPEWGFLLIPRNCSKREFATWSALAMPE